MSDTITAVRVLDTQRGAIVTVPAAECGFAYRDSVFKSGQPGRWVVLAVTYRLRPGGAPTTALRRCAARRSPRAAPGERRWPTCARPCWRSAAPSRWSSTTPTIPIATRAGSFFLNPILRAVEADGVTARAGDPAMPRWSQPDGRVKLSAAWLIERAGFARGARAGPVGLSSQHTLAIVAHEGARARDVIAFARRVQDAVDARFGVKLTPEPVFWGV